MRFAPLCRETRATALLSPVLDWQPVLRRPLRQFIAAVFALLFCACAPAAETTNTLSDAEIQGRELAQKILAQEPAKNYTNTGTLTVRGDNGHRAAIPVICETTVTETNWLTHYEARLDTNTSAAITLIVTHAGAEPNAFLLVKNGETTRPGINDLMTPFAGSDFWLCDLGLEFFHWPQQKIVKKEFHRNCPCTVLESTNPGPSAGAYSRVVCWIDNDSFGIVEAYAYDLNGRKLKNFYPKNLEKVNGQYQVKSMVMDNLQTGSRSRLDFDLDK